MPNLKITELPVADPITGAELYEVVQGGLNKKATQSMLNPFRGDYAGTTTLPTTGGTFTGGVPGAGNEWRLTATLTVGGNVYEAGTIIKAMVNTPGQTLSNWAFLSVQL